MMWFLTLDAPLQYYDILHMFSNSSTEIEQSWVRFPSHNVILKLFVLTSFSIVNYPTMLEQVEPIL